MPDRSLTCSRAGAPPGPPNPPGFIDLTKSSAPCVPSNPPASTAWRSRSSSVAKRPFRKVLTDPSHPQPRVINSDQARLYGSAISGVKKEGILRRRCRHRPIRYLNNILEQDHRAIKRRVKAKQGFRAFHAARRTIQGYEAIHMIRKGQARRVSGSDVRRQIQFINKLFGVVA